jgi:hypothetical protein
MSGYALGITSWNKSICESNPLRAQQRLQNIVIAPDQPGVEVATGIVLCAVLQTILLDMFACSVQNSAAGQPSPYHHR